MPTSKLVKVWWFKLVTDKGFCLKKTTSLHQFLLANYTGKVLEFERFVLCQSKTNQYLFLQIRNANETQLLTEMLRQTKVNKVQESSVLVKTRHEKIRFSVTLVITVQKLPPYAVFKTIKRYNTKRNSCSCSREKVERHETNM